MLVRDSSMTPHYPTAAFSSLLQIGSGRPEMIRRTTCAHSIHQSQAVTQGTSTTPIRAQGPNPPSVLITNLE